MKVGKDGNPVVKYRLSDYDVGHVRKGTDGAAQILEAAGAQRIFSSHSRFVSYEPGRDGGRERFMRAADGHKPDADELRAFIRERLSPQKTPKYWLWVEAWPLTGSGKIQKFKLAEQFVAGEHFPA